MKTKSNINFLKKYWFELFLMIFGLFFLSHSLTKEKINNNTRFLELNATVKSYDFHNGSRGYKQYYIYCNEYCNIFQIKADYVDFFNSKDFPKNTGAKLKFIISKNDYDKLNECNKTFVYGISYKSENLLLLKNVINQEKFRFDLIFPFIFIFGSIILFFKNKN